MNIYELLREAVRFFQPAASDGNDVEEKLGLFSNSFKDVLILSQISYGYCIPACKK